ncbi:Golgi membrane protein 1 [Melanotaenia boesemani]|uniref:Golgi membrane protein 1 n=1 Tax=Melanotaenia boesemani TaxID=1250792 RepID=UPI001C03AD3B|nr:Golgi membrane protein 1 [Melanotaenia boesemani]XP_041855893.1 Golgi membrane protein 1 [Melanotaenia boesemani]
MGALGNGRRGGRPPPLMIAALIACILVLGFNYWVSSSRNLELQTKLYELEGQVRRGAAERGAAEMKKNEFQGEIQRQKEQITHIESFYKKQLESAQTTCSEEKAPLLQNISSNTKTIRDLKGQLNQLNDDVGKLQKELQNCQSNINTLNKKLTYDMTHCHSQVLSQKELCDERVAAAKLEVQKKMEKLIPPVVVSSHENKETGVGKEDKTVKIVLDGVQAAATLSHTPSLFQPKENETSQLLTNNIIPDKGSDFLLEPAMDSSKLVSQPVPSAAADKQDTMQPEEDDVKTDEAEDEKHLKNNMTEDREMEVMDIHEEGAQTEEADPGMEGMLLRQAKVDETRIGQNLEETEDYDAEEQVVDGVDLEKQQQNKDMEEELADYNGDDDNEGEFEADKQAALAQI